MLNIQDLAITRGSNANPFDIHLPSLHLKAGEAVALCGSSGCGKSTILEMVGLILKPDRLVSYQIYDRNAFQQIEQSIAQQDQTQLARLRAECFGFMLQSGGLLPFLSVQENLALPNQILGNALDQEWLNYLVAELQISHLLQQYPKQLSIGERQRVSFIRSISHQPPVLLADEPTAALDPSNAEKLFDIILDVVQKNQIAALVVTHDWDLIKQKSIRVIQGQVSNNQAVFQE